MKKKVAACFVLVCIVCSSVLIVFAEPGDADPKREEKAKQIARAWFNSLMRGNTAVTTALSDVPFALDRKKIIESLPEVEKLYEQIVAKKGKREIKAKDVRINSDQREIKDYTIRGEREKR